MKLLPLLCALIPFPAIAESGTVIRAVDGDTILVSMAGQRVTLRVAGVDAPETVHAKCEREKHLGLAAKAEAQRLLPAGSVVDVRATGAKDKYKRLIARIVLQDGRDFGQVMISNGHAVYYNPRQPKRNWCQ